MKIGCFTPVRNRELYLRSCLMQMRLQTIPPDIHYILINGEDAENYDNRLIIDLIDERHKIDVLNQDAHIRELSGSCVDTLLKEGIDLFFKIDSDDIYHTNYISVIVGAIENNNLWEQENGFCINLVDQLFTTVDGCGNAEIRQHDFMQGLGLSPEEIADGMQVGAPPTFVFDRKVAEVIVAHSDDPAYRKFTYDDKAWRTLLFDRGIPIFQCSTTSPVFSYIKHGGNSSW
jgi:hypothetical protein